MIRFIRRWWQTRQRTIDLQVLWPAIHEQSPSLFKARQAFSVHMWCDPAWQVLGEEEMMRRVLRLHPGLDATAVAALARAPERRE